MDIPHTETRHSYQFSSFEKADKFVGFLNEKSPGFKPELDPPKVIESKHARWIVTFFGQPMLPTARGTPLHHSRHWLRPEYQHGYGHWFSLRKPDFDRCCVEVYDGSRGGGHYQCSRKAKFDPDWTGKPTRCRMHSRAKEAEKAEAARIKAEEDAARWARKRQISSAQREALVLIEKIAAGHNDPRGAALELIEKYPLAFKKET